mmetsp:Transcript_101170/g.286713  ORF Transcript_101170/g.286713 Transcript_101170/m.286713 type:complete len:255 (-) Transcript_101170:568-1332(-)
MLLVSWFRLQQPFRRLRTCETLMTKAVRGTFMSSTAYSGGKSGPSDSSDEELSGSRASNGPLGTFGAFGGFGGSGGGGATTSATLDADDRVCSAPPSSKRSPRPVRRPASSPLLTSLRLPDSSVPDMPCPTASPLNRDRGPPGPWFRAFSSPSGGAHSFFSFQPEFAKSSDMGRSAGGSLGPNAGVQATAGPQQLSDAPPPPPTGGLARGASLGTAGGCRGGAFQAPCAFAAGPTWSLLPASARGGTCCLPSPR